MIAVSGPNREALCAGASCIGMRGSHRYISGPTLSSEADGPQTAEAHSAKFQRCRRYRILARQPALHTLAASSAARADEHEIEAFATVVFSIMWLEAYANQIALTVGMREPNPPAGVLALRQSFRGKEQPIEGKLAKFFTCLLAEPERSEAMERTSELRKHARLLYDVRNELGHLRPVIMKGYPHSAEPRPIFFEDTDRLCEKLALATLTEEAPATFVLPEVWTDFLYRPETARWALNTVEAMAEAIAECFPPGRWRHLAHQQNPARAEYRWLHGVKEMPRMTPDAPLPE